MSDKIARLGIERDNDLMYYIKSDGDVWATPRKQKGQPKGKARKIAPTGLELDYSRYIYFLDGDGDVARKERSLGGKKRAKAAKAPKAPTTKAAKAPSAGGKTGKTVAELERDIEECLAQVKKGNGNGGNGNGNGGKKKKKKGRG